MIHTDQNDDDFISPPKFSVGDVVRAMPYDDTQTERGARVVRITELPMGISQLYRAVDGKGRTFFYYERELSEVTSYDIGRELAR